MTAPTPEQMRELAEDLSYVNFTSNDEAVSQAVTALRAAADEVDRLLALLEYAPHRQSCHPDIACTCWKADAL